MSVLPFDLPDKAIQPTNQFLFLTGAEDFTIPKHTAAKAAKAAGESTFIHICKVHGAGEHYASCSFCVECQRERDRQRYEENRDNLLEQRRQHRGANKSYRLAMKACQRMGLPYKGLKQRLPYSEKEFIQHIENLWLDGMGWDNYGVGKDCWSVDHKVPVSHYSKIGETDITVINALSNLQPLWHSDNIKKGNSLPDGFH